MIDIYFVRELRFITFSSLFTCSSASIPYKIQCTKQNLELFSKALSPIRYLVSVYLLVAGSIIAGNVHLAQAFGNGMTAIGAFLIICCFWNASAAGIMHAGIKRHNKFIILVVSCFSPVSLTIGEVRLLFNLRTVEQE